MAATPPLRNMPKHARYEAMYARFGYFWGLGLEHETYIATSQTRQITAFDKRPERYSVSYYTAYKPDVLNPSLADVLQDNSGSLRIPVLMNCHSLSDCDIYGEHQTTYEREPRPNPKYAGQTMWEWAAAQSPWLHNNFGNVFMWDGDTVEFMTQQFYNATVDGTLRELADGEKRFVEELNRLPRTGVLVAYAPLRLTQPDNPGWATYLTNHRGVAMFNNGTLHINVTLPTQLGFNRQPLRPAAFVERHRALARLVQWMEPLWIAAYGSGDPFCVAAPHFRERFAAGSQRLAVSRYIGIGTFDTDTMPVGKILQVRRADAGPLPWYDRLHARTGYAPLDIIGLDLNFSKHWSHGLELRFFDQMPFACIRAVLLNLVILMDVVHSVRHMAVPDPRSNPVWQEAAEAAMYHGAAWEVQPIFLSALAGALGPTVTSGRGASDIKEPMTPAKALDWFRVATMSCRGFCWGKMVDTGRRGSAVGCC